MKYFFIAALTYVQTILISRPRCKFLLWQDSFDCDFKPLDEFLSDNVAQLCLYCLLFEMLGDSLEHLGKLFVRCIIVGESLLV